MTCPMCDGTNKTCRLCKGSGEIHTISGLELAVQVLTDRLARTRRNLHLYPPGTENGAVTVLRNAERVLAQAKHDRDWSESEAPHALG